MEHLQLEDFRNYTRAAIGLSDGVNLVVGRNAQGKTNLLEAIHHLGGLGSPRAADAALVRDGAERALLHATVVRGAGSAGPQSKRGAGSAGPQDQPGAGSAGPQDQPGAGSAGGQRKIAVDMEIRPGRGTRALVNKTPVVGARALATLTVSVFFGPDELSLVKGSPEGRRRFLDDLAVKLRPARDGARREWERVLKQRNALLKSAPRGKTALPTLEVWDEALCRTGASLSAARLEVLGTLLPYAVKRYEEIAGAGGLDLAWSSSWLDADYGELALRDPGAVEEGVLADMLRRALEEVRAKELERGLSLVGPQRDDVSVLLRAGGGSGASMLEARVYASQGDQRTVALALKLAEHDLLAETLGEEPVLLLDDVFSELDPQRRGWLADAVRSMGQTILSSAEPGVADATRADLVVSVSEGRLESIGG
ncbi:MAG: DNA replication/repair protein RecF [Actinomycetota bacterium]